jgi:hypothetical protein
VNRLQWGKTFPKIQFDLGEISSYFNSWAALILSFPNFSK